MRKTNTKLLNELLGSLGENPRERVMLGSGVSATTVFRLARGEYTKNPHRGTRKLLCDFFKVAEDELFPLARKKSG